MANPKSLIQAINFLKNKMLKLKKSLGQNFLTDKNIIKKIIKLENLKNQTILEIGPGSGNLTEFIVKKNPKKYI